MEKTTCCIVGGGPAGMLLSLLLARKGIDVCLLESHGNFDREFRGDTLHAASLDILEQLGLAERVLSMARGKIIKLEIKTRDDTLVMGNLGRLKTKFPFVALVPQVEFLDLLAEEAKKYNNFHLLMKATAKELLRENESICGVRYHQEGEDRELRALLTVGADGRGSRLRKEADLELVKNAPPMDVLWFTLPRKENDSEETNFYLHDGKFFIFINRGNFWQCGYVILKGSLQEVRSAGIQDLQKNIASLIPPLYQDRVSTLKEWSQIATLSVQTGRVVKWYRPGLLLIGDAAHIMSPVGGVGINYAIQDAVAVYNLLLRPLKSGVLEEKDLAEVQKRREFPTKVIQNFQALLQKQIVAKALKAKGNFRPPFLIRVALKFPWIKNIPARMLSYGVRWERIQEL
ncbi:MAG: FAD-dependent oxidoreductase [Planctomycetota bacterium]